MVSVYCFSSEIDDKRRRSLVYQGGVIIFKAIPEVKKFCRHVSDLCCHYLESMSPETAHHHMDPKAYLERIDQLQRHYSHAVESNALYKAALASVGVSLDKNYWCRITLRVQPEQEAYIGRPTARLPAHRDSWYANVLQQNNWWMPIFPLQSERTLEFYPRYWTEPIENTSNGFDLNAFRESRRQLRENDASFDHVQSAYPLATVKQSPDPSVAIRLLVEPGDLLCFSGSHLHQGIKNQTDCARFSAEVRTVHSDDVNQKWGAPNIDSTSTGNSLDDFYGIRDNKPLLDSLELEAL